MTEETGDRDPLIGPPPPPRRPRPVVTNLLIAANVGTYLVQSYVWGLERSVALYGQDQIAIWEGELWRLLTAPFLHGGVAHLMMNCLGLFLLGEIVEWRLGRWRLLAAYAIAGLAGGLVFQAFPAAVGVGASGAVYGLAGVLLVLRFGRVVGGRFRLLPSAFAVAVSLCICDWLFAWLLEKAAGVQVAVTAHLGGLVSGMVVGYIFQHPEQPVPRGTRRALWAAGAACLIALLGYGCFYPFLNPVWPVWRRVQQGLAEGAVEAKDVRRLAVAAQSLDVLPRLIGSLIESGKSLDAQGRAAEGQRRTEEAEQRYRDAQRRYAEAVRIWRFLRDDTDGERTVKRLVGYTLFDELMGIGVDALAKEVLAALIETAQLELDKKVSQSARERADALNNLAWFLALEGQRLREALACAEAAVSLVRRQIEEGFLPFADPELRRHESAYQNTLGWVQFLIGEETDEALKNLREATELAPLGPNFLYLGMAYASLGDERAAVEALRSAEESGGLSAREQRLLGEVKEELGL